MNSPWRTPRARARARTGIAALVVGASCLVLAPPAGAISGSSGAEDASAAQYLAPSSGSSVPGGAPGSAPSATPAKGEAVPLGQDTPVGAGSAPEDQAVLPATPVAAAQDGLPFTGYLVIGVLVGGLVALLAGLLIRRFTTWRLA